MNVFFIIFGLVCIVLVSFYMENAIYAEDHQVLFLQEPEPMLTLATDLVVEYIGCFVDRLTMRDLPQMGGRGTTSPAECVYKCMSAGKQFAGVQVLHE
jgi:hypothetical protein